MSANTYVAQICPISYSEAADCRFNKRHHTATQRFWPRPHWYWVKSCCCMWIKSYGTITGCAKKFTVHAVMHTLTFTLTCCSKWHLTSRQTLCYEYQCFMSRWVVEFSAGPTYLAPINLTTLHNKHLWRPVCLTFHVRKLS